MKLKKPKDTWIYKIGAVILALLFWTYVMQVQNPTVEQIFYVPLEARNLAEKLVMNDQNIQIEVRVQGSQEIVDETSAKDIHVYADFANVGGVGQVSLQVLPVLPDGLQLVSVDPSSVTVELEEITTRSFPVAVKTPDNAVAYGYMALDAVISPAEIVISGSSSALDNVSDVFVNVPMDNASLSFSQQLQVQIMDKEGNLLNDDFDVVPEVLDVFIPVVADLPDKLLTIDVPIYGDPAKGYQLSRIILEPEAIRVFGSMDILKDLKSVSTATVDISGAKNSITQELEVFSPDGVTIPENEKTVRAILVIESIENKDFENLVVQKKNLAEDLSAELAAQYVNIEVKGPESVINGLSVTDIIPYVDCSGLKAGHYILSLQVNIPTNITLVKMSEEVITVDISLNQ